MTSSAEEQQTLRALIRGRVQGVGFRFFVEAQASALDLKGFVRNLSNGTTVEVVAEGPMTALETLLAALRRGPPPAHVEAVDVSWAAATGDHAGFHIR
jgi:acylphosphatase